MHVPPAHYGGNDVGTASARDRHAPRNEQGPYTELRALVERIRWMARNGESRDTVVAYVGSTPVGQARTREYGAGWVEGLVDAKCDDSVWARDRQQLA